MFCRCSAGVFYVILKGFLSVFFGFGGTFQWINGLSTDFLDIQLDRDLRIY